MQDQKKNRSKTDRHHWKMRNQISRVGKCRTGKCRTENVPYHFGGTAFSHKIFGGTVFSRVPPRLHHCLGPPPYLGNGWS